MTTQSINSTIEKTRKHVSERKNRVRQAFSDNIITDEEMTRLKEDFDESYYELSVVRNLLKQQEDDLSTASEEKKQELQAQIEALQQTEKIVFDGYCHSVSALSRAKNMQENSSSRSASRMPLHVRLSSQELAILSAMGIVANSSVGRKLLKVRLDPEELALLYGVIQSAKDLKINGTAEQKKATEEKLLRVATLIKNGERNKQALLALLQAENTR